MAKGKTKFYAVAAGRKPGIYSTWAECERQVKGFSGAIFKSFKTRDEASAFVGDAGSGTVAARAVPVATDSAPSAAAARTSNPGAKQQSSSVEKRPAVSSRYSAPSAAKRPRTSANDDHNNGVVITVYFDGGARGNPGVAGAGAVITSKIEEEDTSRMVKIRQYCGPNATNNVAEYTGLLLGLQTAKDFAEKYVKDTSKTNAKASAPDVSLTSTCATKTVPPTNIQINIRGDSDLIIKQMNGQYQCKNAKLIPLYNDCRSIASQLKMMEHGAVGRKGNGVKRRVSIDMAHVYRNDNKVADALANEAMDERRSWRTEYVVHADGHEEEVVDDDDKKKSDTKKMKKKSAEVIEIV